VKLLGEPPVPPPISLPPPSVSLKDDAFLRLAGILIAVTALAGLLMIHALILVPQSPYDGVSDPDAIRAMVLAAAVLLDLSVALSVALAWLVAFSRKDIPQGTRWGVLLFAAVFLSAWLLVSFSLLSFYQLYL